MGFLCIILPYNGAYYGTGRFLVKPVQSNVFSERLADKHFFKLTIFMRVI